MRIQRNSPASMPIKETVFAMWGSQFPFSDGKGGSPAGEVLLRTEAGWDGIWRWILGGLPIRRRLPVCPTSSDKNSEAVSARAGDGRQETLWTSQQWIG